MVSEVGDRESDGRVCTQGAPKSAPIVFVDVFVFSFVDESGTHRPSVHCEDSITSSFGSRSLSSSGDNPSSAWLLELLYRPGRMSSVS